MNILIIPSFIYDSYDPTSGSFFLEQAEALQKAGNVVYMLFSDTYSVKHFKRWLTYREKNETVKGIQIYRKKTFCLLKHGSGFYGCYKQFAKDILELYQNFLSDKQIDVIHAHCCAWSGYAAMKLSEKTGIPYVITEHSALYALNSHMIKKKQFDLMKDCFQKAEKLICVSSGLQRLLKPYREDSMVLGNVLDCNLFQPDEHCAQEVPFTFFTVFYMQTLQQCYNKGCDLMLNAMVEVVKRHPDVQLLIGGDGDARKIMEEWISERQLENNVALIGVLSRQQVVSRMQSCDAFVLPSRYETFGVSYTEAMACGKPVIATKNGGPDSFVTPETGLLIDVEDQEQLTAAMLYMVENYQKYDSLKIREHVVCQFSMEAIGEKLTQVYQSVRKTV